MITLSMFLNNISSYTDLYAYCLCVSIRGFVCVCVCVYTCACMHASVYVNKVRIFIFFALKCLCVEGITVASSGRFSTRHDKVTS